jgi:hypothetical protein
VANLWQKTAKNISPLYACHMPTKKTEFATAAPGATSKAVGKAICPLRESATAILK